MWNDLDGRAATSGDISVARHSKGFRQGGWLHLHGRFCPSLQRKEQRDFLLSWEICLTERRGLN